MPSLIDIRRRIRSVRNTQQITKAMKMVSAAKLRRAQERAIAARPYAKMLQQVLAAPNMEGRGAGTKGLAKASQYIEQRYKSLGLQAAGTKGYLDDLEVSICRKFEAELYRFLDNAHRPLLDEIRAKKALDADLTAKVKAVIEEFKSRFLTENPTAKSNA